MTDSELIKNHTIFFAYFCHLIESNQIDLTEELCDVGWELDDEINKRKITDIQIKECIKKTKLDPQEQLMISKYIYPEIDVLDSKISQS